MSHACEANSISDHLPTASVTIAAGLPRGGLEIRVIQVYRRPRRSPRAADGGDCDAIVVCCANLGRISIAVSCYVLKCHSTPGPTPGLAGMRGAQSANPVESPMKADIERSSTDDPRTPCFTNAEAGQAGITSQARESYFEAAGREFSALPQEQVKNALPSRPLASKSAQDSVNALLDVIDELFDAYESEADDWRAESIDFSLPALLHDVVKMFGERAEDKGLSLSLDNSAATPWLVSGDRDCLRQLLVSLLGPRCQIRRTRNDLGPHRRDRGNEPASPRTFHDRSSDA